jgi:2-oxoglutarate/2-oxoacid ferredoxin oxidoreductase subunit alpha
MPLTSTEKMSAEVIDSDPVEPSASITDSAVVVRFCGDSGDGVQLAGNRFTVDSVRSGNDVATFPEFPAEIRAPSGSKAGVSAFQIQFGTQRVYTHGDSADVLVAMNPAALATNLEHLADGGILIVDSGAFTRKALAQAGYEEDPLAEIALGRARCIDLDMTTLVLQAVKETGLKRRDALKARNFFALGVVYWMFGRDATGLLQWIDAKFAGNDRVREANTLAFKAGVTCADAMELAAFALPADDAGSWAAAERTITGNEALSLGLMSAAALADLQLVVGCYPITPASDILHFLVREQKNGVVAVQAEDEMAAIGTAIGASYAGALGVTATSGPGLALKSEALGLAVALELPLVVVDVQRAGPSTGMPTRTEQADLNMALAGRSGEAPLPVVAARSPGDCFYAAVEAVRIAVEHMTPVILLSDAALANSSEPWRIPDLSAMAPIRPQFAQAVDGAGFKPFARDDRHVRRWAIPGTPDLQHRIGGLEKSEGDGSISYDGANHELMTRLREQKVVAIRNRLDVDMELFGERDGTLLMLSWGSTFGAVRQAVDDVRRLGHAVSHLHLRWLNPLDDCIGEIARGFDKVMVPEQNRGQLTDRIRARYLIDAKPLSMMQGRPFGRRELNREILEALTT